MSVNKFIGIGNLTKNPDIRYMPNGDAVTNFAIACNEKWKNKAGEKQESVEYINLVFYRRLAEIAGEYLKKGSQIFVEGKLQTRKWEDKEGKDRYTTEIVVNAMTMLGGSRDVADRNLDDSAAPSDPVKPAKTKGSFDDFDDDIPF